MAASPDSDLSLTFLSTPGAFLTAAASYLTAHPVVSTVVTGVTHRLLAREAGGVRPGADNWWLVVTDGIGTVVGAGMRTAPFPPRPAFLLPMPEEAAVAVAQALFGRGEDLLAVNGALPTIEMCATELARLRGGRMRVAQRTRLHEVNDLVLPARVAGHLRAATDEEVELVIDWLTAFGSDADQQAGRQRGVIPHDVPDRAEALRRIRDGHFWFWVDRSGQPVHLTGVTPPSFGVARIGPVYTPPAERGRGWARNAVGELSRRLLATGARVCLFTDQANPTSNRLYHALGYRPVVDMANLVIDI